MDFDFSEDQRLLKDSVDRLVADRYTFELRRGYAKEEAGFSAGLWAQYAERLAQAGKDRDADMAAASPAAGGCGH